MEKGHERATPDTRKRDRISPHRIHHTENRLLRRHTDPHAVFRMMNASGYLPAVEIADNVQNNERIWVEWRVENGPSHMLTDEVIHNWLLANAYPVADAITDKENPLRIGRQTYALKQGQPGYLAAGAVGVRKFQTAKQE